jgi:hypothetical protein
MIALRLGCSLEFLQVHRRFILRGWVRHADGRLYHPVVTEEVLKMIKSREKWKNKKQTQRTVKQQVSENVPGDTQETPGGVQEVSRPSHSLSHSTYLNTEAKASGAEAPDVNPKTAIWNIGEQYLGSRSMIGKLVKRHGEAAVFHAIAETVNKNPADPKAYISGLLSAKPSGRPSGKPSASPIASEDFANKSYTTTDTATIDWLSQ